MRGLTRSGLVLSSQPVDLGLAAVLTANGAAGRAVVVSNGSIIGRAQARLSPLAPGDDILSRLVKAPLFAQLRYAGPADTLWRLIGVETIDLSGPSRSPPTFTARPPTRRFRAASRAMARASKARSPAP